jgi:hypothetical protein
MARTDRAIGTVGSFAVTTLALIGIGVFTHPQLGRAEEYKSLAGVNCQLKASSRISWDADQFLNGAGVGLSCEGQAVDLVDGKVANGWLVTKNFGKIRLKNSGGFGIDILVTPDQNEQMKKAFKKG